MKGKFVRSTLALCLALMLVIALSSCKEQPAHLLLIKTEASRTVAIGTTVADWRTGLAVSGYYSDGTVKAIPSADYSVGITGIGNDGTFAQARSYDVEVSHPEGGNTYHDTFTVTVQAAPVAAAIDHIMVVSTDIVVRGTSLDNWRENLKVIAYYEDDHTEELDSRLLSINVNGGGWNPVDFVFDGDGPHTVNFKYLVDDDEYTDAHEIRIAAPGEILVSHIDVDAPSYVLLGYEIQSYRQLLQVTAYRSDGTSVRLGASDYTVSVGGIEPGAQYFNRAGDYTVSVSYTVEGKTYATDRVVHVIANKIPTSIEFIRKYDCSAVNQDKQRLTGHNYVWFQPSTGVDLPEGAANTEFDPVEFPLYLNIEFADGSRIVQRKLTDLVKQGIGEVVYTVKAPADKTWADIVLEPGDDLSALQEEGYTSGQYDLEIEYTYAYSDLNPVSLNLTGRAVNGDGVGEYVEETRMATKAITFEKNIVADFYYPVIFSDHPDIADTADAGLTSAFTLPTAAITENKANLGEAGTDYCENHFAMNADTDGQSIGTVPDDGIFGHVWLRDLGKINLGYVNPENIGDKAIAPTRESVVDGVAAIVFDFDEWNTIGSDGSLTAVAAPAEYMLVFDDATHLPTNQDLCATYRLSDGFGVNGASAGDDKVVVPGGIRYPYGGGRLLGAYDFVLSKTAVGRTWVGALADLNGASGRSYRGYELDKATKMDVPYSRERVVLMGSDYVEATYKADVAAAVSILRPTTVPEPESATASTVAVSARDGSSYVLVTATYRDGLYPTTTPEFEYAYRLFIGGGPDAGVVCRLAFDSALESVYDSTDADAVVAAAKAKLTARDFSDAEIPALKDDIVVTLLDKDGQSYSGTAALAKGHYLVKAAYEVPGTGKTIVASYAITIDPVIKDALGVDADIIPQRYVVVDEETSVRSEELPTQADWTRAVSLQIAKPDGNGIEGYAFPYYETVNATAASGLGLVLSAADEWVRRDADETIGGKTVIVPVLMDRLNGSLVETEAIEANPTAGYRVCEVKERVL